MRDARVQHFGWRPDVPDHRDFSLESEPIARWLARLRPLSKKATRPASCDHRAFCGPAVDQEDLPTGAASACAALVQYSERRATGGLLTPSRLFLHRAAAHDAGTSVAASQSLRHTLRALARCGAPPERVWPYRAELLDRDPDPFAFTYQRPFRHLRYFRLAALEQVLALLAAGFPVALGFTLCSCASESSDIPFPTAADAPLGGDAALAVGYDDARRIRSTRGALLVRLSWGTTWGDGGYGWLPYEYLRRGLARDFWTATKPSWLRSGEFRQPMRRDA